MKHIATIYTLLSILVLPILPAVAQEENSEAVAAFNKYRHNLQDIQTYWEVDIPEAMDSLKLTLEDNKPALEIYTTEHGLDENGGMNTWINVLAATFPLEQGIALKAKGSVLQLTFLPPTREQMLCSWKDELQKKTLQQLERL